MWSEEREEKKMISMGRPESRRTDNFGFRNLFTLIQTLSTMLSAVLLEWRVQSMAQDRRNLTVSHKFCTWIAGFHNKRPSPPIIGCVKGRRAGRDSEREGGWGESEQDTDSLFVNFQLRHEEY